MGGNTQPLGCWVSQPNTQGCWVGCWAQSSPPPQSELGRPRDGCRGSRQLVRSPGVPRRGRRSAPPVVDGQPAGRSEEPWMGLTNLGCLLGQHLLLPGLAHRSHENEGCSSPQFRVLRVVPLLETADHLQIHLQPTHLHRAVTYQKWGLPGTDGVFHLEGVVSCSSDEVHAFG